MFFPLGICGKGMQAVTDGIWIRLINFVFRADSCYLTRTSYPFVHANILWLLQYNKFAWRRRQSVLCNRAKSVSNTNRLMTALKASGSTKEFWESAMSLTVKAKTVLTINLMWDSNKIYWNELKILLTSHSFYIKIFWWGIFIFNLFFFTLKYTWSKINDSHRMSVFQSVIFTRKLTFFASQKYITIYCHEWLFLSIAIVAIF